MSLTEVLVDDADLDAAPSSGLDFFVVGIGASAGGLKAVKTLLEGMPTTPDMALVVVLHLSPKHESNAAAIFQPSTRMPVTQVNGHTKIERNHVYVIPPNRELTMVDGALDVTPSERTGGPQIVIDHFFRTLAHQHKTRAVGIVLSGTGSDGSVGIASLKEKGGIAIAKAPDDAEHNGMPASAIATGKVDIVLPVADIPERLIQLWNNASRIEILDAPISDANANETQTPQESEEALRDVMKLLLQRTGHNFKQYKRGTVLRRIERRMQVNRLPTLIAYRSFIASDASEPKALLSDMLIGVTQFFRDRPAFEALEREVLPEIFQQAEKELEPVRGWIAGCSTGEEAYSIAILMQEEAARRRAAAEYTLFATDIDAEALARARAGAYPAAIVTDVAPEHLRSGFTAERGGFRVHKALRDCLIFAEHNVLSDPPFSRVHLVSCRNLLIYLDRAAQHDVLQMFHFALRPGGYLFLGSSETVDADSRLFSPVDKAMRLYRSNPVSRPLGPLQLRLRGEERSPAVAPVQPSRPSTAATVHRELLEEFAPPTVLTNAEGQIVHVSKHAPRFLRYAAGEPTHSLLQALPAELRPALRAAVVQARQLQARIDADPVALTVDGEPSLIRIAVQPVRHAVWPGEMLIVSFDESDLRADAANLPATSSDPALARLEEELQRRTEQLRTTIEQYEASCEELKASNEELQAINEELRSATEELETSKEELQSTNEELSTVNSELKLKIDEAAETNDDLNNVISSSEIATVFVDTEMRIKRFTPAAAKVFNLIPADIGRSLFDITHRLQYEDLADDAQAVFSSLKTIEREVQMNDRRLLARLLPYRTADNRISGAVLNFIDVTSLREAESRSAVERERALLAAETMTDFAIMTMDPEGLITSWNAGARHVFGYSDAEAIGQGFDLLFTEVDREAGIPATELRTALAQGRAPNERWMRRKDGSTFFASGVSAPLRAGAERGFAKICRDMTGLRRVEELHEQALLTAQLSEARAVAESQQKNEFLAVMSHELKHPLNLISVNAQLLMTLPEAKKLPVVTRAARTIHRTVMSQGRIIDDLLDMSRMNTGKLTLNRVPLMLGEAVQPAVNWAITEARERGQRVLAEGLDEPISVDGDATRIEQIAWNLLSNALKFSPKGGTIRVRLREEAGRAVFEVSDEGRGISQEFLPYVFQMFKQAVPATKRGEGGLGIGLAMVKNLSELHGGGVEVESAGEGRGATFRVFLPLQQTGEFASLEAEATAGASRSLTGLRVLLVDDMEDALESFRFLLEHVGYQVTSASSAKEAIALTEQQEFDLLISDVGMPEMDGYELMTELRGRVHTAALPGIALTGYGRTEDVRKAFAAGFQAHLDKPVDIEQVQKAIATVIGARAG
jgi:two-component system CheB/CheR fusion protein